MPAGAVNLQPVLVDAGIVGGLLLLMAVFAVTIAVRGMPERMDRSRSEAHPVIGVFLIEYWMWLISPVEKAMLALKLSPSAVTLQSLLLHLAGGACIALGHFTTGGWLFLLGATFDILDGRIARLTGRITTAGAFLDSVLDRYGEMATLMGFGFYYFAVYPLGLVFAALAALGAIMVSYTRSRAESLGADAKGGFMQRPERAFFIGIVTSGDCFVTNFVERGTDTPVHWPVVAVLAFVAVTANVTAIQRIFVTLARIGEKQKRDDAKG